MMDPDKRWVLILVDVVLAATCFFTVIKIFVGEIVSKRFSMSRLRFDGGNYGEKI